MPNTTVKRVKQSYWAGDTFVPGDTPGTPSYLGSADSKVVASFTEDLVILTTS